MESTRFYVGRGRLMENREVPQTTLNGHGVGIRLRFPCQQTLIRVLPPIPARSSPGPRPVVPVQSLPPPPFHHQPLMTAPVPWSLAWSEDGELAPQDRFDLLQTLVQTESLEVQCSLIAAVESMTTAEITSTSLGTSLSLGDVTGLSS